jgi:hypothetical protein
MLAEYDQIQLVALTPDLDTSSTLYTPKVSIVYQIRIINRWGSWLPAEYPSMCYY